MVSLVGKDASALLSEESKLQAAAINAEACKTFLASCDGRLSSEEVEAVLPWTKTESFKRLLKQHEVAMKKLFEKALEAAAAKLQQSMAKCETLKTGKEGRDWKSEATGKSITAIISVARKHDILTSSFAGSLRQALTALTKDSLAGAGQQPSVQCRAKVTWKEAVCARIS